MRSNDVTAKGGMPMSTVTTVAFRTATHPEGCPKCGRHEVMLQFEPPPPAPAEHGIREFLPRVRYVTVERMHVQCETCGYEWHELPKDAPQL